MQLIDVARTHRENAKAVALQHQLDWRDLDAFVYTTQQSLGCIADSLPSNQARKLVGNLFEHFIGLLLLDVGIQCAGRTVNLPIPGSAATFSYELDVVFSLAATPTDSVSADEIVGSIKTTSKDRLDKIFLDKFLSQDC